MYRMRTEGGCSKLRGMMVGKKTTTAKIGFHACFVLIFFNSVFLCICIAPRYKAKFLVYI